VFLVEFNDKVDLSVGFTGHPQEIRSALVKVQAGGLTALLDAVKFSLSEMKKAKNPRKAIVVVSDGGDNHSTYTAAQIEALVREADVEIYAMGVFDPLFSLALTPEEVSGPRLLSEIAVQTGGRAFAASLPGDLPSVAARIAIELHTTPPRRWILLSPMIFTSIPDQLGSRHCDRRRCVSCHPVWLPKNCPKHQSSDPLRRSKRSSRHRTPRHPYREYPQEACKQETNPHRPHLAA
jgi:hypothetical protein